jgi:uncharacterized protein (TIGR02246 family)
MTRTLCICGLSLLFSAGARAQDKAAAPAGMPDMSKMGPMSRPVTKEKEAKKGIDELYKTMEQAWKGGDLNGVVELIDFPVIMLSDDSTGTAKNFEASREQWTEMMKPMFANMPKDMKMSNKHTTHLLSDTLAVVVEDTSMAMGKVKGKWKGFSVVNYKDGKWKVKEMAEAGWGDMKPPSTASAKK